MIAHRIVSEQDLQSRPDRASGHSPTLWIQLAPHLQKQLAQHWAKLVKQMRQRSMLREEENDVRS
jgi:hypothetical protein